MSVPFSYTLGYFSTSHRFYDICFTVSDVRFSLKGTYGLRLEWENVKNLYYEVCMWGGGGAHGTVATVINVTLNLLLLSPHD